MKKNNNILEYEDKDCEILKHILNGNSTKKGFFEENRFATISVVFKEKNLLELTGIRTSIGYILSNKFIYDFVSNQIYSVYDLYEKGNKEKSGEFVLVNNIPFKNSNSKIRFNDKNFNIIRNLLEKYIDEYNEGQARLKQYDYYFDDEEHIPEYTKKISMI